MSTDLSRQALLPNEKTRKITVGKNCVCPVSIGGGSPVVVQSMLNTCATDFDASIAQLDALVEAGCEMVRIAIPNKASLPTFAKICKASPVPVVADIHFDAKLALAAIEAGACKIRINPGNIGGLEKCNEIIAAAKAAGVAIRIGVNAGSLNDEIAAKTELTLPQKLAASAIEYVEYFEAQGFFDLVVSAKAHDVQTTIATYKLLSERLPEVPLHLGVTEAGGALQGTVKSACALGILLNEGIGDTFRISLTDNPTVEVRASWHLLSSLGLRRRGPEMISCPTCGRCQVDLIGIAGQVEERLSTINKPIKVAVMGCVVNGPGEAADADVGVACGAGQAALFSHGKIIKKVDELSIVDALMEEVQKL
jgi:(E)-4-hydroxy-3-methylbut-2-enyl-diphosphate synthase